MRVKVWDVESGNVVMTLKGHPAGTSSVAFSPDGSRIVSSSHDGALKLWDAESGSELLTLTVPGNAIQSIAFSPDGRRIVLGGSHGTIRVWSAPSPEEAAIEEITTTLSPVRPVVMPKP